jgi:hypothetical protein
LRIVGPGFSYNDSTGRDVVRNPGRRVEQPSDIEEEDERITKLHQNLYRAGELTSLGTRSSVRVS